MMSLRISPANQQLVIVASRVGGLWRVPSRGPAASDRRALGGRSSIVHALIYSLVRPSGVEMLRWSITAAVRSSTALHRVQDPGRCRFNVAAAALGCAARPPPSTTTNRHLHARHTARQFELRGGVTPPPLTSSSVRPSVLPSFHQRQRRRHAATCLKWKRSIGEVRRRRRPPVRPVGHLCGPSAAASAGPGSCVLITRVIGRSIRRSKQSHQLRRNAYLRAHLCITTNACCRQVTLTNDTTTLAHLRCILIILRFS